MAEELNKAGKAVLFQEFEIEDADPGMSESDVFNLLAERIAYMIEYKMEVLLSLMYRNDIDETKVNAALSPLAPDPPAIGLAKLVMNRQKQRMATKEYYKQQEPEDLDEALRY